MNQHTRDIILDSLVLVAFSSILGGLSLLISKSFSGEDNPALDLITVMKKAESKEVNASTERRNGKPGKRACRNLNRIWKRGRTG